MYNIGDILVCGSNGVCTVTEIGPLAIMGKAARHRKFYTLRPYFDQSGRVYIPVDCDESAIRPALSKEEVEQLISEISELHPLVITDEKQREAEYKNAVNSSDPRRLIMAIKTMRRRRLQRLENGKKSTAVDERYLRIAEQRLFEEVSLAMGTDISSIKEQITTRFEAV